MLDQHRHFDPCACSGPPSVVRAFDMHRVRKGEAVDDFSVPVFDLDRLIENDLACHCIGTDDGARLKKCSARDGVQTWKLASLGIKQDVLAVAQMEEIGFQRIAPTRRERVPFLSRRRPTKTLGDRKRYKPLDLQGQLEADR